MAFAVDLHGALSVEDVEGFHAPVRVGRMRPAAGFKLGNMEADLFRIDALPDEVSGYALNSEFRNQLSPPFDELRRRARKTDGLATIGNR